jgi:methyltransferase
MNLVLFAGGVMIGLMLAEARLSWRHERALLERGAVRPAGDVYPAMAALYPLAFGLMIGEGAWRAGVGPETASTGPAWWLSGVLLFVASKALKYWAIAVLGDRWSFRVIVEPDRPLVHTGPYRYLTHPNYVAVVGELVAAAMMVGARITGPITIAAFGAVLWARIRFEDRVLASMRRPG